MRERPDGLLEAETFEEHMMPGVTWIDDPAYAAAFADLIGETLMTDCAAYTKPEGSYPGYVNVTRDHTGAFILTVRADPKPALTAAADAKNPPVEESPTSVLTIPEDDWHQFMAMARRLPVPKEGQHDAGTGYSSGGAAAGDPLDQRAGEADEGGGAAAAGAESAD